MEQFLIQLPALIGVIVGAVASYLITSAGAKAQWTRSERVRWEDKRLQVYASYSHTVKRVSELSKRICASRGLPTTAPPISVEQGLKELSDASIERAEVWESLLLLGDSSTVAAARSWHRSVWRMEAFARGQLGDPAEWRDAVKAADEMRHQFYETARWALGIEEQKLPEPKPPEPEL
jgi:hypothetical protein